MSITISQSYKNAYVMPVTTCTGFHTILLTIKIITQYYKSIYNFTYGNLQPVFWHALMQSIIAPVLSVKSLALPGSMDQPLQSSGHGPAV